MKSPTQKILFMRRFKKTPAGVMRTSGTHIKIKDYFLYCLQHPQLEPYLYFTADSVYGAAEVWADIPPERIVSEARLDLYDALFLTGRDWKFLPKSLPGKKIINRLASIQQCQPEHPVFRYLKRPAFRICASREIHEAILPYISGEAVVINNGIPLELFGANGEKSRAIMIWARKQPEFGAKLFAAIKDRGWPVNLLVNNLPREQFAQRLKESDVAITLPEETEGFYMPALEAMASGCAVICPDAGGNRAFCLHEQTCLMPQLGDLHEHLDMLERLLHNQTLKENLRRQGMAMAQSYSVEKEREKFYRFLEKYIFAV
jgi:hypothetical protein